MKQNLEIGANDYISKNAFLLYFFEKIKISHKFSFLILFNTYIYNNIIITIIINLVILGYISKKQIIDQI